jgi:hypothetical protein
MAIAIPISIILGKSIYSFLGGEFIGQKINRELCDKLKANITTFVSLHGKIKQDIQTCNDADKRLLRKEFGNEVIEAFTK